MRRRDRGLTLIELMVSLAIGSLLIVGAVFIYSQSRSTYRVSDTVARVQENARYVLSILEPDIQLAGYYGFSNRPDTFGFVHNGSTADIVLASGLQSNSTSAVEIGGIKNTCERNFAVNLVTSVQGTNNRYYEDPGCAPVNADSRSSVPAQYKADTDTLTVRRAAVQASEQPVNGTLQVITSRFSNGAGYVFSDGIAPPMGQESGDTTEVHDVLVHTYYVSENTESPARSGLPSLRVKALTSGPDYEDEQVISGVEDLQVELGIEHGVDPDHDGVADAYTGSADSYLNPSAARGYHVVAVRVWLLMRAEQPEPGYTDTTRYRYAGKDFVPNDHVRRVLISRTIQLRNSRTM